MGTTFAHTKSKIKLRDRFGGVSGQDSTKSKRFLHAFRNHE